jgi:hypothetical protein
MTRVPDSPSTAILRRTEALTLIMSMECELLLGAKPLSEDDRFMKQTTLDSEIAVVEGLDGAWGCNPAYHAASAQSIEDALGKAREAAERRLNREVMATAEKVILPADQELELLLLDPNESANYAEDGDEDLIESDAEDHTVAPQAPPAALPAAEAADEVMHEARAEPESNHESSAAARPKQQRGKASAAEYAAKRAERRAHLQPTNQEASASRGAAPAVSLPGPPERSPGRSRQRSPERSRQPAPRDRADYGRQHDLRNSRYDNRRSPPRHSGYRHQQYNKPDLRYALNRRREWEQEGGSRGHGARGPGPRPVIDESTAQQQMMQEQLHEQQQELQRLRQQVAQRQAPAAQPVQARQPTPARQHNGPTQTPQPTTTETICLQLLALLNRNPPSEGGANL